MLGYIRLYYHPLLFWIRNPENVVFLCKLQSIFVFFFLKNKELLKFEPQMSFLLDDTSQQKGLSQFLINQFLMCKTLLYP